MREEGWILSNELLDPLPPVAMAFKTLYEAAWDEFTRDIMESPFRFFNLEQGEFSGLCDWSALCAENGIPPCDHNWAIPDTMEPHMKDMCRQIRSILLQRETQRQPDDPKVFRDEWNLVYIWAPLVDITRGIPPDLAWVRVGGMVVVAKQPGQSITATTSHPTPLQL